MADTPGRKQALAIQRRAFYEPAACRDMNAITRAQWRGFGAVPGQAPSR
jgi:hypothetical protein